MNYKKTLKTLENFEKKDEFYYWFRLKKEAQIISKKQNQEKSLNFINKKFKKLKTLIKKYYLILQIA